MCARAQSGRGQHVPGTECNGIRMQGEAAKLGRGSCQSMRASSLRATGSQGVTAQEASPSSLCLWAERRSEVAGVDCRWGWLLISIFRISLESNNSHLRIARTSGAIWKCVEIIWVVAVTADVKTPTV